MIISPKRGVGGRGKEKVTLSVTLVIMVTSGVGGGDIKDPVIYVTSHVMDWEGGVKCDLGKMQCCDISSASEF